MTSSQRDKTWAVLPSITRHEEQGRGSRGRAGGGGRGRGGGAGGARVITTASAMTETAIPSSMHRQHQ